MNDLLLEFVTLDCPICDQLHQVEKRSRTTSAIIKGERITYQETYYKCANCGDENEFIPGKILDENLLAARNEYRTQHHMLTSQDIVDFRARYGLTQKELAKALGWGEATIARYETKLIQDETHDDVLQAIRQDALEFRRYLERSKDAFPDERYSEIISLVEHEIEKSSQDYLTRKKITARYIPFQNTPEYTGNTQLNISKVCNMVAYFAKYCRNLYKVKLMKLLWYTDALFYQKYDQSMSGLVYQHMPMGALPVGHYELMDLIPFEEVIDERIQTISYKILPNSDFIESQFSFEELDVLSTVRRKFSDYSGSDLATYMHKEIAYTQTKDSAYIPFSLAKQIRPF